MEAGLRRALTAMNAEFPTLCNIQLAVVLTHIESSGDQAATAPTLTHVECDVKVHADEVVVTAPFAQHESATKYVVSGHGIMVKLACDNNALQGRFIMQTQDGNAIHIIDAMKSQQTVTLSNRFLRVPARLAGHGTTTLTLTKDKCVTWVSSIRCVIPRSTFEELIQRLRE